MTQTDGTATSPLAEVPDAPAELRVDVGQLREAATHLLSASSQFDALGGFAAGGAQVPDWWGTAATAYHRSVTPLRVSADVASLALRGLGARVLRHAERMHDLLRTRETLLDARSVLAQRRADVDAHDPAAMAVFAVEARVFALEVAGWTAAVAEEEAAMRTAFERSLAPQPDDGSRGDPLDPADGPLAAMPPADRPDDVRAWWQGLTPSERLGVLAAAPGLIGNLAGLPARVRERANQLALERDLADLRVREQRGLLTPEEAAALRNARAARAAERGVAQRRDPVTGDPLHGSLYIYDPSAFDGDGSVALAVGDLDGADNVSVLMPGFTSDGGDIPGLAQDAANVVDTARSLDPAHHDAALAWLDYDAPDNSPFGDGIGDGDADALSVATEQAAVAGGDRLAHTLLGLGSERAGTPGHLTVIGHSYGSTTVGHALSDHPEAAAGVDDVVLVGSPGAGGHVEHAEDLHVDPTHVWAGSNSHDPVSHLGDSGRLGLHTLGSPLSPLAPYLRGTGLDDVGGPGLGYDPAGEGFGGQRFTAELADAPDGGLFDPHEHYFDPHTESLDNIGHVVDGQADQVMHAAPRHHALFGRGHDPESDRTPSRPDTGPW